MLGLTVDVCGVRGSNHVAVSCLMLDLVDPELGLNVMNCDVTNAFAG